MWRTAARNRFSNARYARRRCRESSPTRRDRAAVYVANAPMIRTTPEKIDPSSSGDTHSPPTLDRTASPSL